MYDPLRSKRLFYFENFSEGEIVWFGCISGTSNDCCVVKPFDDEYLIRNEYSCLNI